MTLQEPTQRLRRLRYVLTLTLGRTLRVGLILPSLQQDFRLRCFQPSFRRRSFSALPCQAALTPEV